MNYKKNESQYIKYFTDQRPLEPERMKAIRIKWARYYLKVKNQTLGV